MGIKMTHPVPDQLNQNIWVECQDHFQATHWLPVLRPGWDYLSSLSGGPLLA